jgi:hypothetical protein
MKIVINFMISLILMFSYAFSQDQNCECLLNKTFKNLHLNDPVFTVVFKDGSTRQNCFSLTRVIPGTPLVEDQQIRLCFNDGGKIESQIVNVTKIKEITSYDVGGKGQNITIPILPAREFYKSNDSSKNQDGEKLPFMFIELMGGIGYGGKDTTTRTINGKTIGFKNFCYNGEALAGFYLTDRFAVGVGAGIFSENSRLRYPLKGELRYTFRDRPAGSFDSYTNPKFYKYYPDPCKIHNIWDPTDRIRTEPVGLVERNVGNSDSTVILMPVSESQKEESISIIEPYIFAEGGLLIDGKFDGSGKDKAVNPEEFGEYFAGAGLGATFWNFLTCNLSYRYYRLNIRTDCPVCDDAKIINTNNVHTINLKLGFHFNLGN